MAAGFVVYKAVLQVRRQINWKHKLYPYLVRKEVLRKAKRECEEGK